MEGAIAPTHLGGGTAPSLPPLKRPCLRDKRLEGAPDFLDLRVKFFLWNKYPDCFSLLKRFRIGIWNFNKFSTEISLKWEIFCEFKHRLQGKPREKKVFYSGPPSQISTYRIIVPPPQKKKNLGLVVLWNFCYSQFISCMYIKTQLFLTSVLWYRKNSFFPTCFKTGLGWFLVSISIVSILCFICWWP